jgi:hypothetical protein
VFVSRFSRGSGIGLKGVLRMTVLLARERWELGRWWTVGKRMGGTVMFCK